MRNLIGAKRVLPAAFAVGALLVSLLVAVPLLAHHTGHGSSTQPSPTPSPEPTPSGAVAMVQGSRLADGIEVGFPQTAVGAISAAAEYLDAVASTLDPDYAASVMRVAGDPANNALPADLAQSTVTLRGDLQLPTTGPLAPPVSFQTAAEMYQVRDAAPDSILVLLLTSSTFINAHGGTAQTTGVFPVWMHWVGGDWKLTAIGASQNFSSLDATPDTQAAVSHGWLDLVAATGGTS